METVHLPRGGTARWFDADGPGPTLVTVPAMGVPAAPYQRFARHLRERGVSVVTGDYRGQGESRVPLTRASRWGYAEHAEDVRDLVDHVREERGGDVVLVCHSLGGQMAAALEAAHPGAYDGMVLAASSTPYWRGYPGRGKATPLAASAAFAAMGRVQGVFEGRRLGFGRQSRTLMAQWRGFAWTGRLPGGDPAPRELPVLAVSFAGDTLAPPASVDDLVRRFPAARVTRRHLDEPQGHAGWLRDPEPLADEIVSWLP